MMRNYFPLIFLITFIGGMIWLWRRGKRNRAEFARALISLGLEQAGVMPDILCQKYPFLQARTVLGSALFLLGHKMGGVITLPGGGTTQASQTFLGFVVPPTAIPGLADPALRKELASPAFKETLADGSQMWAWQRLYTAKNLEKTFGILQHLIRSAAANPSPQGPAPEAVIAQAATPRSPVGTPLKRRFHGRFGYRSDTPAVSTWGSGFVSRLEPPTRAELEELFKPAARQSMIDYLQKDIGPVRVDNADPVHELPAPPLPSDSDRRPLKHWKISGRVSSEDLRFDAPMVSVFGWPEQPPKDVLHAMLTLLATEAVVMRGADPSYGENADVLDVKVEPTAETLTYDC